MMFLMMIRNVLAVVAGDYLLNPPTGDENKPLLWIVIAVAAALGILVAIIILNRKKK